MNEVNIPSQEISRECDPAIITESAGGTSFLLSNRDRFDN